MEGLSYYHTYDRLFLGLSIAMGFMGWTTYVILVIVKTHTNLTKTVQSSDKVGQKYAVISPCFQETAHIPLFCSVDHKWKQLL